MPTSSSPRGLSARLFLGRMYALEQTVQIARRLRLNRLRRYAPRRIEAWYGKWRLRRRVFNEGVRLVPEQALEASYFEAIRLLRSKGLDLGDYLEFGVYSGASLACMHRALRQARMREVRLFGFDSFEGFPEHAKYEDDGAWAPGDFKCDYETTRKFLTVAGVDWRRVTLTKGWFADTLTPEFVRKHDIVKASLIMVDCDLYTSSRQALAFCAPLIRDAAVIFFDDWNASGLADKNMGQKRAFDEFLRAHPHFAATELPSYTSGGDWVDNAKVFFVARP